MNKIKSFLRKLKYKAKIDSFKQLINSNIGVYLHLAFMEMIHPK